eukprot:g45973.t1
MLCYVTRPDSVVMEVEVDPKANGEDCLNQVCHRLGIIEDDYLGLQYSANKGETLWLNLRNRISQQIEGMPPYRFKLRVKFFVEPHLLLQEQTRHQFFLHVRDDLLNGRLLCSPEQALDLSALLAQVEFGDYNQNTVKYCYEDLCANELNTSTLNSIVVKHKELEGMSPCRAEYRLLQIACTLEHYGVEWHSVKDGDGQKLMIGDFIPYYPDGYSICKKCLPYNHKGVWQQCDTVTNAVMMQYSRDFKGHLASLFLNESINLGESCQQSQVLQEKIRKLKEALLCMVCCGEEINTAFCPCGHMVCCGSCANQLQ